MNVDSKKGKDNSHLLARSSSYYLTSIPSKASLMMDATIYGVMMISLEIFNTFSPIIMYLPTTLTI
jgi:hypothetical protein